MKKINLYICLIVSLAFILTSCGDKTKVGTESKTKDKVSLVFSTFYDEGAEADAYKEIVSAFNESHNDIKVTLQTGAVGYNDKIKTALQTGKGPDIIGLQRSSMLEYAKGGSLKDISEWVGSQGLKDKYYGVSLGYGKLDGKYYGVGDYPNSVEWFYNTDLFKKARVNQPKNIDELSKVCSKLKRYTSTPLVIAGDDEWAVSTFFGMITSQTVNTEELSRAFADSDKPAFMQLKGAGDAVGIFNSLIKNNILMKKSQGYDYADSIGAFVNGKAAILPMGSWAVQKIEKEKPKGFNYSVFDSPVLFASNSNSELSATSIEVITVNAKGSHTEEAMEFMSYLFGEEAQKVFAQKNGISGMVSANTEPDNDVKKLVLKHLGMTDENSTMFIDNVSQKMMDSTGTRLMELFSKKYKSDELWQLIVNESFA